MPRIAIAGFQHETNCLSPVATDLAAFAMADSWPELLRGDRVLTGTKGMNLPIAGFAKAALEAGATLVPVLWCAAEPAGRVTDEAFDTIAGWILDGIRDAGPIDGIYLDLHGAMITETHRDGEGALLTRIRETVGRDMPVAISLDLHANLSAGMVDLADVITIYRTYPHLDMGRTGGRAWDRLAGILANGRPAKAFHQARFVVPLHAQHTGAEPARSLYEALPDDARALVEMAFGFSAGDTPDRVPSVVAHARTLQEAERLADEAFARLNAAELAFETKMILPDAAVAEAMANRSDRPVVLADVQDNAGAGASSDTTGLLRALVAARAEGVLMGLMHDPVTAAAAHRAGIGAEIDGELGGRSGLSGERPFSGTFCVEHLSDGFVRYTGEMYGGGIATLGPSCVVSLPGSGADIRIVVTSVRNQCLDLAHFTSFGLDPMAARIVCVKSTAHFRADFEPIAQRVIPVACPGLFPCDVGMDDWPG